MRKIKFELDDFFLRTRKVINKDRWFQMRGYFIADMKIQLKVFAIL